MSTHTRVATLAAVGLAAALGLATSAEALTLTNRETSPQTIRVTESGNATELQLAPGEVLDIECASGCDIEVVGGTATEPFNAASDQKLEIKDGKVVESNG
ncbi:MAG: hypothetical protein GC150_10015 [Rhizobiales bacterium]|nr:hypothetical protein [Hyphomicrobiales bacterium]